MVHDVHIKQIPPQPVATRRVHTTLENLGEAMHVALGEIAMHVEPKGAARGAPFAVYHNMPFQTGDVDVELGLPLVRGAKITGDVRARASVVPGGSVAYTIHVGDYGTIGKAYEAIYAWLDERGYRASGPPREIYLVGPDESVLPSEYRTEIDIPLA